MVALVNQEAASVPLWLIIACEELRVFGDFRTLTAKVMSLPGSLSGLLQYVITRLVTEDETGIMQKVGGSCTCTGVCGWRMHDLHSVRFHVSHCDVQG